MEKLEKLCVRIKYIFKIPASIIFFIISIPFHILYVLSEILIAIPQTIAINFISKPVKSFVWGLVVVLIGGCSYQTHHTLNMSFTAFLIQKIQNGKLISFLVELAKILFTKEWLLKGGLMYAGFYVLMYILFSIQASYAEKIEILNYELYGWSTGGINKLIDDINRCVLCIKKGTDTKEGFIKAYDKEFRKTYGSYRLIKDVVNDIKDSESN